jgi:methylmalonyl-CoA decarboxylase
MALIRLEVTENVGTLTLDHLAKRNALSEALIGEVLEGMQELQRRQVRVAILRAPKGAKVWSAGHDVGELPMPGRDPLGYHDPLLRVIDALRRFPAPVLALVEGSVWGGACEVVFCCDMVITTPAVTFAITPAKLGVPYNAAGVLHLMNVVPQNLLKEMFFTAAPMSAGRLHEVGVINSLVEATAIEEQVYALAQRIALNSPLAIGAIKEQLRMLGGAHPLAPETFERLQGLRRKVYDSADYLEGLTAFKQKRSAVFRGQSLPGTRPTLDSEPLGAVETKEQS